MASSNLMRTESHRNCIGTAQKSKLVHPRRSLVVLPPGDGKILFADYTAKTHFVKRMRITGLWSKHAIISCRFSKHGKQLYVVAIEMKDGPPKLRSRTSKKKKKPEDLTSKKDVLKPARKEFRAVIYTYRISRGKTTRAPPVLIDRGLLELGRLIDVPAVRWGDHECILTTRSDKNQVVVHQLRLLADANTKTKQKTNSEKSRKVTATIPSQFADHQVEDILVDDVQYLLASVPTTLQRPPEKTGFDGRPLAETGTQCHQSPKVEEAVL